MFVTLIKKNYLFLVTFSSGRCLGKEILVWHCDAGKKMVPHQLFWSGAAVWAMKMSTELSLLTYHMLQESLKF
jgi:hypothetical protein